MYWQCPVVGGTALGFSKGCSSALTYKTHPPSFGSFFLKVLSETSGRNISCHHSSLFPNIPTKVLFFFLGDAKYAKSRAWLARILTCLRVWRACVLACLHVPVLSTLDSFMFLRVRMSYMFIILKYFTCLRACVLGIL